MEIQGRKDYSLSDISDMARCSILFDSYKDIPNFLQRLKQNVPNVTGYIARFSSGYRGIHLNFEIDGITVEIQLSTKKAWEVKQLTEHCYTKCRSFNQRERFGEIMEQHKIVEALSQQVKDDPNNENLKEQFEQENSKLKTLKEAFSKDIELQKAENQMTSDLYKELHSDGEFNSIESEVESMLLSYEANKMSSKALHPEFKKPFKVDNQGKLDLQEVKERTTKANEIATKTQENLINNVKEALSTKDKDIVVDNNIKKGMTIVANVMNAYNQKLDEKLGNNQEIIADNINIISYQRYNIAVEATKFALKNDLPENDTQGILKSFYEDLQKNPENYPKNNYSLNSLVSQIAPKYNSMQREQ